MDRRTSAGCLRRDEALSILKPLIGGSEFSEQASAGTAVLIDYGRSIGLLDDVEQFLNPEDIRARVFEKIIISFAKDCVPDTMLQAIRLFIELEPKRGRRLIHCCELYEPVQ